MQKKLWLLILLFIFCCSILVAKNNIFYKANNLPRHSVAYFDKNTFFDGVQQSSKNRPSFAEKIYGGIIPHHLFVGFIIADFFYRLSQQQPKTVIIIGPNHYERGVFNVLSSLYGWETPFGVVKPETRIIAELVASNLALIDETNVPNDHSVAGIIPYIKYYLPNARIVPLLLSSFMTEEEVQLLSKKLSAYVTADTVLIAAVDFSHYLKSEEAKRRDNITIELIKNHEYNKINLLSNEYLDSTSAINTFLQVMKLQHVKSMDILYHTNSGEIQRNNAIETTSYFSIAYY